MYNFKKKIFISSMNQNTIYKFISIALAFLWCYQGLVPKLLFIHADEIAIWQWFGLSYSHAMLAGQISGVLEIIFGLTFLISSHKYLHYLNIMGLIGLFILVTFLLPQSLIQAFNPVIMNFSMLSLSVIFLMLKQNCQNSYS